MAKMIEPDYVHYTRIKTINAKEAQMLLAVFALRDKDFQNKEEYEQAYKEQMKTEGRVLWDALSRKAIKYPERDIEVCEVDEFGEMVGYHFDKISININKFCRWALDHNYDVPEVLARLVQKHDCSAKALCDETKPEQSVDAESNAGNNDAIFDGNTAQPAVPKNKSGKPKGYLAQAIEHAYTKYRNEGNTEILRENNVREFVKRLKELADEKGNPNFSTYIADRIDSIKISSSDYTIKTKDKYIQASNQREIKDKGRNFGLQRVSQILVDLRAKYPLPT